MMDEKAERIRATLIALLRAEGLRSIEAKVYLRSEDGELDEAAIGYVDQGGEESYTFTTG